MAKSCAVSMSMARSTGTGTALTRPENRLPSGENEVADRRHRPRWSRPSPRARPDGGHRAIGVVDQRNRAVEPASTILNHGLRCASSRENDVRPARPVAIQAGGDVLGLRKRRGGGHRDERIGQARPRCRAGFQCVPPSIQLGGCVTGETVGTQEGHLGTAGPPDAGNVGIVGGDHNAPDIGHRHRGLDGPADQRFSRQWLDVLA